MNALRSGIIALVVIAGMVGAAAPAAAQSDPGYYYNNYYPPFWQGWYVGVHLGHGEVGSLDGFLGGGQVGKNWQSGQIVYGWEADVTVSDISDEFHFRGISAESSIDWMATVRGRLGLLLHPSVLAYATAGLGLVSGSSSVSVDDFPFDDFRDEFSVDDTQADFVFGLGLEGKLSEKTTLRVEYLGFSDTEVDVVRAALNLKLGY